MDAKKIIERANTDGRGWRNRNPAAEWPSDQAIKNHYSKSRADGHLGTVSRAPRGVAWELYHATFLNRTQPAPFTVQPSPKGPWSSTRRRTLCTQCGNDWRPVWPVLQGRDAVAGAWCFLCLEAVLTPEQIAALPPEPSRLSLAFSQPEGDDTYPEDFDRDA